MDALEKVMLKKIHSFDRLDLDSAAIGRLARAYRKEVCTNISRN